MFRKISVLIPSAFANANENVAKNVKLRIKPTITPSGRLLPPVSDPDNTIGKMGNMQGDKIVTNPAIKAKTSSIIIVDS